MSQSVQKHGLRPVVAALTLAAMLATTPAARAADDYRFSEADYGVMVVDGVLVRPLGLVATAAGAVFWVVTLPFSALGGNVGEAADTLIVEPARFTFTRPLGDL